MQISVVLICSLCYIALLFLTAWWVERRKDRGQGVVHNPYVYSLSLAVYCTAWTFYGSVGRASVTGLNFLAIYFGPTLLAPLWIMVLRKIILISKNLRITSIADFISSRYGKSSSLATAVTLIAVIGLIPYISLQLKAITFGINVLTGNHYEYFQSGAPWYFDATLWITAAMAVFTVLFGARKIDPNERHEGLVAAVAFESLVKLIAFFVIGYFVVFGLYNGLGDLYKKAFENESTRKLFTLQASGGTVISWNILMLLSALSILCLPRQFHIGVVENSHPRHILTAMWVFPLYLLLINIFVLPVALAGRLTFSAALDPDTYVLNLPLALGSDALAVLAFIGGFSAATSMVIVESTALSIMISNHLAVPLLIRFRLSDKNSPYVAKHLLRIRWVSIVLVLLSAYVYLITLGSGRDLVSVGLISFTAVAQFAPAALGGLYWKRATYPGALAGLVAGFLIWAFTLPLPTFAEAGYISPGFVQHGLFGLDIIKPNALFGLVGLDAISHSAFWSLSINACLFVLVSLNTKPSPRTAAQAEIFVDIERYNARPDFDFIKREASIADLEKILTRFLGSDRCWEIFEAYEKNHRVSLAGQRKAAADLVNFSEKNLAGAIGAASARLVMDTIAKEEPITLEEIMKVLEQTQEVLQYSRALEVKSTELEATTRQLTAANEQLKTLDSLKADFITTVTHELRTPVTSIKSLSKIMLDYRDELPQQKIQEYLEVLVNESERISRLINQVLDLEKIQSAESYTEQFFPVDFGKVVSDSYHSMEQLCREKNITCTVEWPGYGPVVEGHRDCLTQVTVNLLSNAMKFATTRVAILVAEEEGYALLRVHDDGPGISEEHQHMIFEKFTQVHDPHMGKPQGSGLGLFITKMIVEQHGGSILVESSPGQGAKFEVRLPILDQ